MKSLFNQFVIFEDGHKMEREIKRERERVKRERDQEREENLDKDQRNSLAEEFCVVAFDAVHRLRDKLEDKIQVNFVVLRRGTRRKEKKGGVR